MRKVQLQDGSYIVKAILERRARDVQRLFKSHEAAMWEIAKQVENLMPQIAEDEPLMCFRRQPLITFKHDIQVADFMDLELKGVIVNFRPDHNKEHSTSTEDKAQNDFYFYEIDKTFAQVMYNCVALSKNYYQFKSPFRYPQRELLRSPADCEYQR